MLRSKEKLLRKKEIKAGKLIKQANNLYSPKIN